MHIEILCYAQGEGSCSSEAGRWECSQLAGWEDFDRHPPWMGHAGDLAFLATAEPDELRKLAEQAHLNLGCGAWEGAGTSRGGWRDRDPDHEAWHATVDDFMDRFERGDRILTEGMVAFATYDLACELAHLRGWCPSIRPTAARHPASASVPNP